MIRTIYIHCISGVFHSCDNGVRNLKKNRLKNIIIGVFRYDNYYSREVLT